MMIDSRRILAILGAILCSTTTLDASIVFTSRSDFEAATSGLQVIPFDGLAPIDGFSFFNSPPGLTTQGVNFQAGAGTNNLFVIDPGFGTGFEFPTQFLQNNLFAQSSPIVATLPAGITAVGSDVSAQFPPSTSFLMTATLSTGEVFSVTVPSRPDLSFLGFTSDVPISSIAFNASGNAGGTTLDNFTFGQQAIPEPTSIVLLSLGVVGLLVHSYRRRLRRPEAVR